MEARSAALGPGWASLCGVYGAPRSLFSLWVPGRAFSFRDPRGWGPHDPAAAGRPCLALAWVGATAHGKRQNWLPAGAPPVILQPGFWKGWGRTRPGAGGRGGGGLVALLLARLSRWPRCLCPCGVAVALASLGSLPREVQPARQAALGGDSVNWRNAWERAGSPLSPHTTRPHVLLPPPRARLCRPLYTCPLWPTTHGPQATTPVDGESGSEV